MSGEAFDISGALTWEEGLPRPQWNLIESWVESHHEPEDRHDAWVAVERQWLAELGAALGGGYEAVESDHFVALVPESHVSGRYLLSIAERCRTAIPSVLGEVADFEGLGKHVLMALRVQDDYYRYISYFYPEGNFGGSAGIHLCENLAHIALNGTFRWMLESTVAHELTHVSLRHLSMPQWAEEGLARMFEHDLGDTPLLMVDAEMAGQHKRYWGKRGLDAFWRGEGFSRPGKVQELSYQLAEILIRLLVEETRPRWFGFVKAPQRRLFAFLREANVVDCGEAACRAQLGFDLSDLAAKFLGPGSWSPSL